MWTIRNTGKSDWPNDMQLKLIEGKGEKCVKIGREVSVDENVSLMAGFEAIDDKGTTKYKLQSSKG